MAPNDQLFVSCSCTEARWACMSKDPKWGVGVFSWHRSESAARWNADIIGGWAIPAGKDGFSASAVAERLMFYPEK